MVFNTYSCIIARFWPFWREYDECVRGGDKGGEESGQSRAGAGEGEEEVNKFSMFCE